MEAVNDIDLETAYHEAGHAVVASRLNVPFFTATIVPEPGSLGSVNLARPKLFADHIGMTVRQAAERVIIASFAGLPAQRLVNAGADPTRSGADIDVIYDVAAEYKILPSRRRKFIDDEKQHAVFRILNSEAIRLVTELEAQITSVAEQLMKSRTLHFHEIQEILA